MHRRRARMKFYPSMKSGLLFNCIQELFSRAYGLITNGDPYPLRSLLERECERLRPGKVLDIGCGSGCYALRGYDYLGIDPNPAYIAHCRRNRPGRFEQMRGEHLDFPDNSFDMVLCLSVGHHLSDDSLKRVCDEIKRVLSRNGVFIFADSVRPIVGSKFIAALLEWLDEGKWFRNEVDHVDFLARKFLIERKQIIYDQFYRTLVLFCRKKPHNGEG